MHCGTIFWTAWAIFVDWSEVVPFRGNVTDLGFVKDNVQLTVVKVMSDREKTLQKLVVKPKRVNRRVSHGLGGQPAPFCFYHCQG